jgi:hypothetical protein
MTAMTPMSKLTTESNLDGVDTTALQTAMKAGRDMPDHGKIDLGRPDDTDPRGRPKSPDAAIGIAHANHLDPKNLLVHGGKKPSRHRTRTPTR